MSLLAYLKCRLGRGHRFKLSRSQPGVEVCTFCHLRREAARKAAAID